MRFGVLWALFLASAKMFVRNRAAVFFSLFLPLIIMLIFGVLNFEGSTSISLGIVDEAQNDASAALADRLAEYEYLEITDGERDAELAALEEGDRGYVVSCSVAALEYDDLWDLMTTVGEGLELG